MTRLARRSGRTATALRLGRPVQDSAGLDSAARVANLQGAMRAVPPHRPGAPAIIVDDITTTGATLSEAARALRSGGWRIAGAATVAATVRRHPLACPRSRV